MFLFEALPNDNLTLEKASRLNCEYVICPSVALSELADTVTSNLQTLRENLRSLDETKILTEVEKMNEVTKMFNTHSKEPFTDARREVGMFRSGLTHPHAIAVDAEPLVHVGLLRSRSNNIYYHQGRHRRPFRSGWRLHLLHADRCALLLKEH